MPQFLRKRRIGVTVVGELVIELGIEHPLLFMLVMMHQVQGSYGADNVTQAQLRAYEPYQVIDRMSSLIAQLKEKGFVHEDKAGILRLSPVVRAAIDRVHTEATAYLSEVTPLPKPDMERLASKLRRAVSAIVADPNLAPHPGSHLAGALAMERYGDQSAPMVSLESSILELWGARDDAHIAAWREAVVQGPPLDVLTQMWLGANTTSALTEALQTKQTPHDIESSLAWLVECEYVERDGDQVRLTPVGVLARDDIEHEMDRIYFAAWPFTLEETVWVKDKLQELVDKLPGQTR